MNYRTLFLLLTLSIYTSGCSTTKGGKETAPTTAAVQKMVKGEISVLLAGAAEPGALVAAFKQFGLSHDGPTSRSQNQHRFSFNAAGVSPDEILKAISAFKTVKKATLIGSNM